MNVNVYNIIIDLASVYLYSLILISLCLDKTDKKKFFSRRNLVIAIVAVSIVSSVFEAVSCYLEYKNCLLDLNLILVIVVSITDFVVMLYVSIYQFYAIGLKRKYAKSVCILYSIVFVLFTFAIILGAINGKGMYFDKSGTFTQGKYWCIYILLAGVMPIMNLTVLLFNKAKRSQKILLSLFNIIPCGAMLAAWRFDDYATFRLGNIALITLLYIVSYNELAKSRAATTVALEKSKSELVFSQIRPHFLFNTLTAASELCHSEPEKASELLVNFSKYLRANLDSMSNVEPIPFRKELSHIKAYTDIEQLRFGDRVKIVLDIGVSDFVIPAVTVQPLVENSIRHGISEWKTSGTVTISTWVRDDSIFIRVSDTGHGFEKNSQSDTERSHLGISNVRHRIESFGGTLTIRSEVGVGTAATITIPKNQKSIIQREGERK